MNTMLTSEADKNQIISSCDFEVELDERQLCDVELLMQGGFSPLEGFMSENDYTSVVNDLKLSNGLIFGLVSPQHESRMTSLHLSNSLDTHSLSCSTRTIAA